MTPKFKKGDEACILVYVQQGILNRVTITEVAVVKNEWAYRLRNNWYPYKGPSALCLITVEEGKDIIISQKNEELIEIAKEKEVLIKEFKEEIGRLKNISSSIKNRIETVKSL